MCIQQTASKTSNKSLPSGDDAAGPRLHTNADSVTNHDFGSDGLLGATQLALPVLMFYRPAKRHLHSYLKKF